MSTASFKEWLDTDDSERTSTYSLVIAKRILLTGGCGFGAEGGDCEARY